MVADQNVCQMPPDSAQTELPPSWKFGTAARCADLRAFVLHPGAVEAQRRALRERVVRGQRDVLAAALVPVGQVDVLRVVGVGRAVVRAGETVVAPVVLRAERPRAHEVLRAERPVLVLVGQGNRDIGGDLVALELVLGLVPVAGEQPPAEVPLAGDAPRLLVVEAGDPATESSEVAVVRVGQAERGRAVGVDHAGIPAEGLLGGAFVDERVLGAQRPAGPVRRQVADRIAVTGVERAGIGARLAVAEVREQAVGGEAGTAGHAVVRVFEVVGTLEVGEALDVVVRGQAVAELQLTPLAVEADPAFPAAHHRGACRAFVGCQRGFALEDGVHAAAQRFGTAQAPARRHALDTADGIVPARAVVVDHFGLDADATVQRDVRGLCLRQRGGQQARDGESDELLVH